MKLVVNGCELTPEVFVKYQCGQYYVPVRDLFTLLGGTVVWQQRENQAVVKWRHNLLIIPFHGNVIWINGEKRTVSNEHTLVDGRLYVSLLSMAEAFNGVLKQNTEEQHLFLPLGNLQGLSFSNGNLMLQWTGNRAVDVKTQGGVVSLLLEGTAWPEGLEFMQAERTPQGHIHFKVKLSKSVEHAIGEQGLRLSWKSSGQALAGLVIAVDAGHGGGQPGAVGYSGVQEKDLTRKVADVLNSLLSSKGATVIDVRTEDHTVSLAERVIRARQASAQAFISIHFNSHERAEANGTETYYASNGVGQELAHAAQEELVKALALKNRGVKQASFYVLQALPEIPSILVEIGFISNPVEEAFLTKQSSLQSAAEALCKAVERCFVK